MMFIYFSCLGDRARPLSSYWHLCAGVKLHTNPNDCEACATYFKDVTQKLESKTQNLEFRFAVKPLPIPPSAVATAVSIEDSRKSSANESSPRTESPSGMLI